MQCCHLSTCFRFFLSSLSYISGPCRNACVQSFACNYRSDIGWLVSTLTHVLCTLDRRLFSCVACCIHRVKGQIDNPCENKTGLLQQRKNDGEVASMTRHDPLPADLLYIAHIKYANIVSSDLPLCPRFRNMVVKAQSEGIGRSGWRLAWPVLHEPLRSRLYPLKLSAKCQ